MAEVISIIIRTNERDRRKIIVTYVPPRTNTWKLEEYKTMQKEVLKCLADMMRKDKKILLMGDFNCRGVNWKEMEGSGTEGSWSEEMLKLVMENTLDQWVEDFTRLRGEDKPSMLDLVFTKKQNSTLS